MWIAVCLELGIAVGLELGIGGPNLKQQLLFRPAGRPVGGPARLAGFQARPAGPPARGT